MKRKKPPVGGSGDWTSQSYQIRDKKSSQSLEDLIGNAVEWLHAHEADSQARQVGLLALGEVLLGDMANGVIS